MAKALKIFIVLLLLLSAGALFLATSLFGKREILKGRTQKLEKSAAELTASLSRADEPYIADLGVNLDRNKLMDLAGMDTELGKLKTLAGERYRELGTTYADLKKTNDELAERRIELAQLRQDLERARQDIVKLNETITQRNADIAAQREQIENLDRDKANLQIQIDDLNTQIAKNEDDLQDQRDKILTLEQTIGDLESQLGGPGVVRVLPKGLHGRVVVVNKQWNFVILDIGSKAGLVPNAEMLVHRGDKLVGKVFINGVTRDLAIADIRSDWAQMQIREGDFVAVQ
ncbi:MAG: hypothetical protein H3C50_01610 [Kiritimatiellae bacterium]|nr:hypothetical protein [Kiritimatiellia bacterium]MCO5062530.1 hypothetical protein [Kiritimatiellia bacterium]MCO5068394.1 hypothetical protein [Kiritimatiellia bacterium]MCO6400133.1 hypothetical protein [Verrucomicrobiota bacterium]